MNRIIIIGWSGSGKSTFARKLGEKLKMEVIHLDKIYHKPGWKQTPSDEFTKIVKNLITKEKWIIDGHYGKTLDLRAERADTIIFFNFNKFVCLYRAFKRIFNRNQPFDKVEGNFDKISWELVKRLYNASSKKILARLEPYKNTKKIFIVRNSKEAEELLIKLVN